jgi:acyl carrier protein
VNAPSDQLIDEVRDMLVTTLGIEDRAAALDAATPLLGTLPELDSMTVLELVYAIETRFGVEVDGEEVTVEVFETLGSLTDFVAGKLA